MKQRHLKIPLIIQELIMKMTIFLHKCNAYRTLADSYNDKYEFILPEINYEKQLFSNKFGYGNLSSNLKVEN